MKQDMSDMNGASKMSQKRCPSCGFWLATTSDAHAPPHGFAFSMLCEIPVLGSLLGFLLLRNHLRQYSSGPYWCWRCKREVPDAELTR